MNHITIFNILGPEWLSLKPSYIAGTGAPHWAGCHIRLLLGLSSTTWLFRGRKDKPKMGPPLYIKCKVPEISKHREIYMVNIDGIYRAIMKTKKCKPFRILLRKNGIMI